MVGFMFPRSVDVMLRFSGHSSWFSSRGEIRNYRTFQADESKVVMREILEDPDEYVMFITRYSVSYLYRGLGSLNRIKNDHVA